jgi:hypothetical protein
LKTFIVAILLIMSQLQAKAAVRCENLVEGLRNTTETSTATSVLQIPEGLEFKSAIKLHIDTASAEITSVKDPRYQESFHNILEMLTETIFLSGDRKTTLEKGKLNLARNIGNGQSVEFEYIGDRRGENMVFRLAKVVLYKANGQDVSLEKNPVSDDGLKLRTPEVLVAEDAGGNLKVIEKSDINKWAKTENTTPDVGPANEGVLQRLESLINRMNPQDALKVRALKTHHQSIRIPLVIQGPLLQNLLTWAERMPYVSRPELRAAVQNKNLNPVIWKARFRSNVDFTLKVAKKQIFKYILIGGVFFGGHSMINQMTDVRPAVLDQRPSVVSMKADKPSFTINDSLIINRVLKSLEANGSIQADALRAEINASLDLKKSPAAIATNTRDAQSVMAQLIDAEVAANGQSQFYLGDTNMKLTSTPTESLNITPNTSILIGEFSHQQKIILIPITTVGSTQQMSQLVLSRSENPRLYDALSGSLRSVLSASK